MTLELTEDGRNGVAGERHLAIGIKAVDRLDEADGRDLEEVVKRLLCTLIATGKLPRQWQEALHELVTRLWLPIAQVPDEQLAILAGADAVLLVHARGHGS